MKPSSAIASAASSVMKNVANEEANFDIENYGCLCQQYDRKIYVILIVI